MSYLTAQILFYLFDYIKVYILCYVMENLKHLWSHYSGDPIVS